MKKVFAFMMLLFLSNSLISQDEVTFNFSRKKAAFQFISDIVVYINGEESVRVANGATSSFKRTLDTSKPVNVMIKVSGTRLSTEMTFMVTEKNACNFEMGFESRDVYLKLLSGGIIKDETVIAENNENITPLEKSELVREEWIKRGGKIVNESFLGSFTYIKLNKSELNMTGSGGQLTFSTSILNLKIPEFKTGIQHWSSFVYGFAVNLQYYGAKMEVPSIDPIRMGTMNYSISLNGGYTFGLGSFLNESSWKGVAIELTYRPSFVMSTIFASGDSETSYVLNMGGVGVDFNFNSFTTKARKLAPKSKSKFSIFILPPVKDMPLIINIGYGRTFYRKW